MRRGGVRRGPGGDERGGLWETGGLYFVSLVYPGQNALPVF